MSEFSVRGGVGLVKAVLFDVDGVFLDESRCFDVSALTVYELLYHSSYLGLNEHNTDLSQLTDETISSIRSHIFRNDQILNQLKSLGINSNWDMLFVVFSIHLIDYLKQIAPKEREAFLEIKTWSAETLSAIGKIKTDFHVSFKQPLEFIENVEPGKNHIYEALQGHAKKQLNTNQVSLFDMKSPLWHLAQELYQEWYLGHELYEKVEHKVPKTQYKKGYIYHEIALAPIEPIKTLLTDLKQAGYLIAIATGRPRTETIVPFEALGLLDLFDAEHIVSASEVLEAEKMFPDLKPLGKPNPFSYITTYEGNQLEKYFDYATQQEGRMHPDYITIVGDSLADLLSAKVLNARFIGTLTGLKGKKAADELKQHGAEILVDNVLDIRPYLLTSSH